MCNLVSAYILSTMLASGKHMYCSHMFSYSVGFFQSRNHMQVLGLTQFKGKQTTEHLCFSH